VFLTPCFLLTNSGLVGFGFDLVISDPTIVAYTVKIYDMLLKHES
jgi:hypothetical protein